MTAADAQVPRPSGEAAALVPVAEPAAVRGAGVAPEPARAQPQPATPGAGESATRGRKICPGCHRFNAAAAGFCSDCGVALPATSTVPLFGGPAGFWIRVVASLIDAVVTVGVLAFLADRLGFPEVDLERMAPMDALLRSLPEFALNITITSLYAMIMVGAWGGTVGKLVLGLRIVRHSDGGKVPYGLALGHSLAGFVSAIPLCLGYLWVALSPSKRGWHDYLCDTRVVYLKPE